MLLFCSQTDTFGQVLLEAQASGLPVGAVRAGGPAELIRSGWSGLLLGRLGAGWRRALVAGGEQPIRRAASAAEQSHTASRTVDQRCFGAAHRRISLPMRLSTREGAEMRSRQKDQASGTVDKIAGRVLDAFGKLTGNRKTQAKGKAARGRGSARTAKGRGKGSAKRSRR